MNPSHHCCCYSHHYAHDPTVVSPPQIVSKVPLDYLRAHGTATLATNLKVICTEAGYTDHAGAWHPGKYEIVAGEEDEA